MRKSLLTSMFICALFFMAWNSQCLLAQEITVPDYSYGEIHTEYGNVTPQGVGIIGAYSTGIDYRPSGTFIAGGYRWWDYPSYRNFVCYQYPHFNYPGSHGVWDNPPGACLDPPIGHEISWGGVVADPDSRTIWCLMGSEAENGPYTDKCIPFGTGQICYPPPQYWGYGSSYGYLRKMVVVQSTGSLKAGDPVNIKISFNVHSEHTGNGVSSSSGFLFMNKLSQVPWTREYLKWADREMFSPMIPMLARFDIGQQNNADDSTVTVTIRDTIIVELLFNNTITHLNPHGTGEAEGWAGEKPADLFSDIIYTRTDSVNKIIKKYGNRATFDLVCLTQGAILSPLTPAGPNVDEDRDGISDTREKGADGNNSTFDGNADGIPDYKQANVASFHTYDGQNYVTLVVPSGTGLSQMKVTGNPSPSDTPADAEFPFGFFDFSIDGLDPGEAVNVILILHDASSVTKYYKYGPTPDNMISHWYEFTYNGQTGAEINGNVITLHFVDGLRGDEDITVNCSIKEPGGPAIAGATGILQQTETDGIVVYPNPANDYITLKLSSIIPSNAYILRIHSITGEILQEKIIDVYDANEEFVIPTNNLPYGIYLITLSGSNRVYKTRFIRLK